MLFSCLRKEPNYWLRARIDDSLEYSYTHIKVNNRRNLFENPYLIYRNIHKKPENFKVNKISESLKRINLLVQHVFLNYYTWHLAKYDEITMKFDERW